VGTRSVPGNADRAELENIAREASTDEQARLGVCLLAARHVQIEEDELRAARRRAVLILATGGDPHRELDLDSVALRRLGDELDRPDRRAGLAAGLQHICDGASDLPAVREAAEALVRDPEKAWRLFAACVLVDELEEDE
jgi:hypothetical protein